MNIYQRADKYGAHLEGTCVSLNADEVDSLMKGKTKADRKQVLKVAFNVGLMSEDEYRQSLRYRYYNPYRFYKTDTHIIYVHSAVEYFIKVENN